MKKISFRQEDEEHNFWQNYTDLMSGILVVFIIISVVAWYGYIKITGNIGGDGGDIMVTIQQSRMVREFNEAQKQLNSQYFSYNEEYQRFECKVDVQFREKDASIPENCKLELIEAGKELEGIIQRFSESVQVSFKVIIEGRAARHLVYPTMAQNHEADKQGWAYAETLSYDRARSLYNFWKSNGILDDIEKMNGEIFISGSGFGGQGRYPNSPQQEERNRTFIIQIIPYIK